MADQDFFSTNVPASNPKPGHPPESTDSFAKAIQSRFGSSSLTLPPPLHLPSTSGNKKKPNKHGFSLSMPAPALSLPTPPPPPALSSASSSTIPTHASSSSQLLCSAHPPSDIDQFVNNPDCLILDIRSHAAFTTARLNNALSLSVPSTLLKRPLYSLEKLALMLSSKSARTRFSAWAQASSILVYDADSFNIPEGSNLHGLLKKFRNEGYPSEKHLAWLKGGFVSVWRERKDLVISGPDKAQVEEDDEEDDTLEPLSASQSTGLLRASALPSSAFNLSSTTSHRPSRAPQHSPTQPTSLLPAARIHSSTVQSAPQSPSSQSQAVAFNPFYDTVRQNLELSQGISERIPLTLPASVRDRIEDLPFRWLRHVARRAAPASKDYTPLERSAENTEEDASSSSSFSSSSSSACDSDPDTTPPLLSPDAPRPRKDLVEEGTEALAMQFYRIELGEQRRLMGIMQHHSSESGRVLTSSSSGSPSSEENFEAPVPRVRHHKSRLNRTEVSFPYSITAGVEKGAKNRYRNIWPFEHARVRLLRSSSDDYINASFVQPLGTYKRYIATQGPLEATLSDFWTLVWEQNVHVIIMLTQEVEGMHVKCCNYWDSGQYGPFTVKMVQTTETADERRSRQTQPTEFSWDLGKSSPPPGSKKPTITRRLELSNKDFLSAGTRSIVQMQYLEWPDLNVPDDPRGVLDLVTNLQREVDSIVMTNPTVDNLHPDQADPNTGIVKRGLDHPPVLLHCSAGVGRTGGFIAVDAILDGVRREVRKRRAAVLRRKQERRNRVVHESSQSPPFGTDRDIEMSDSNPSPPQVSMVLDEAIDAKLVRPTDRSLVMPIHGAPHSSGEPLFHVPVAGWAREDGSSTSGGERDGDLSSQRDSPSPSEPMDIDEKESARSKLRRQKLEQSSPWTGTRRELKEWPTSGDSDRSNHLVRPHAKRMLSNESDVHQVHSDRSSSSGDYHAFASGSATGSSSGSDLNLAARLRKSVETQQLESQMTNVSVGAIRKLSPPTSVGSSSGSNYRARTTSIPGTLSSSPAPPPPSTYPSPSPKRPNHRHRQSDETTGRLSSPLGSSEGYSTGGLSVFGLPNRDETTAPSSLPSSHKRTSDEGSASAKERQHSSRSSSDRECGIRREADNVSRSPPSGTIEKTHSRPFDYADPREIFVDEETPPMLSTFGEPIRRILEDMREQRMSLCQSLRQYVFVHRAIIEGSLMIVDEEKEREKEAKFVRQYECAHAPPKRPSLSQMRRTTSFAEKAPVPKDILSATQPVQFISNPLLTAGSSVSISSSDHSSIGFFAPVRNAKRNASPTELKEDTTDDTDLSKRPSTKRRHTEDVKERHTRPGGLVSPVRATGSFPHSGPHHHSSAR